MTHLGTFTLTEIARLFGEPQHRLIHLCEKGVIHPDHQDAEGRGSSRLFSERNILEFAITFRLRALNQPLEVVGAVLHVLQRLEREVRHQVPGFTLPEGLRGERAPDLRLVISDGTKLFFLLGAQSKQPKVFGGTDIAQAGQPRASARALNQATPKRSNGAFGGPEGSRYARLELSISRIAQDLPLD